MPIPSEVIIVIPSSESSSGFVSTIETLKKFNVPYRCISPSTKQESKNSDSVFCLIIRSQADCIRWANRFYPHTPKLLVSKHQEGSNALTSVIKTANQSFPNAMPTFALGKAGETNAAIFAVQMLALSNQNVRKKLLQFRKAQTQAVLANSIPGK